MITAEKAIMIAQEANKEKVNYLINVIDGEINLRASQGFRTHEHACTSDYNDEIYEEVRSELRSIGFSCSVVKSKFNGGKTVIESLSISW